MNAGTWRTGMMIGMFAAAGLAGADEAPVAVPPAEVAKPAEPAPAPAVSTPAPAAPAAKPAAAEAPAPAPVAAKPAVIKAAPAKGADAGLKGTVAVGNAPPAEYPELAKIQLQYAIRAAMTKVQGKLLKVELEPTAGFLVWEVEIVKSDKSIFAVKVDAGSGAVLAVERDEPGKDGE